MNIPNLLSQPVLDERGRFSAAWQGFFSQLISEFQGNLSNEGYKLPHQTTAKITVLNTMQSEGALLYNKETKKGLINIDGDFKEILTS